MIEIIIKQGLSTSELLTFGMASSWLWGKEGCPMHCRMLEYPEKLEQEVEVLRGKLESDR